MLEQLAKSHQGELGGLRAAAVGEADRLTREVLQLGQVGAGPVAGPPPAGARATRGRRAAPAPAPDALDRLLGLAGEG